VAPPDTAELQFATDIDISSDGLTYTATLRQDATFHDGSEVTAADFVYRRNRPSASGLDPEAIHHWEGEIHTDDEELLPAKTTDERYPALCDRVVELHPYDVPCVERFDETAVLDSFGNWRAESIDGA